MTDQIIQAVEDMAERYKHKWLDRTDSYWLQRILQEVGEAASVMAGDHDDSLEHELLQIASICVNFLRKLEAERQGGKE